MIEKTSLKVGDILDNKITNNKELMKEWDYKKNININPSSITLGSSKKVWWKCSKGHSYIAAVYSRKKSGCPYCSNRLLLIGYNDFATQHPDLLCDWDYEKNGDLKPQNIMSGSAKKVWWKCPKGHSTYNEIRYHSQNGHVCKYCGGKVLSKGENDLLTNNPYLLKEWDYEKNGDLKPENVAAHSNKKVWWKCPNGHQYVASISNRNHKTNPTACPYCTNQKALKNNTDFESKCPELMKEWDFEKNKNIDPSQIYYSTKKKVWWKCYKCGYIWKEDIYNRVNKDSYKYCPMCTQDFNTLHRLVIGKNDLKTMNPYVAEEWNYEKNGNLKPENYLVKSNKKVWWKCSKGHEWSTTINSRTSGTNCPICNSGLHTSFPEQAIYFYLKKIYSNVQNRFILDDKYEYDIFIKDKGILIEYDGVYYHKKEQKSIIDTKKEEYAKKHNYIFYRIKETYDSSNEIIINDNNFIYFPDRGKNLQTLIELFIKKVCNKKVNIDIEKDYIKIESLIFRSEITNSLYILYPKIANEWDYEKNGNLHPKNYLAKSGKIVWWKCSKGHEWKSRICDRIKNGKETKCPYCSCKRIYKGYNDLATKKSSLLDEWDYEKNKDIKPDNILYNSSKKVWWKCSKGHSFLKPINKKRTNNDCPYCSGRKIYSGYNDFGTLFPDILKEWDYIENKISPKALGKTSEIVASWRCSNCGTKWKASIWKRCMGYKKCPNCYKKNFVQRKIDFEAKNPELVIEWHPTKNGKLLPSEIPYDSKKQIWWKCSKCSYEWENSIYHRRNGSGCPRCAKTSKQKKLNKKVINLDTGEIFNSLTDAAKAYNLKGTSSLTHCIQRKQKTCMGYRWDFYKE